MKIFFSAAILLLILHPVFGQKVDSVQIGRMDSMIRLQNKSRFSKELNQLLDKMYIRRKPAKIPYTNTNLISYDGSIIRNIEIRHVDMFAVSVMDTFYSPSSWAEKTGNSIHVETRDKIIERNMIIHPGDRLDVFLASENERIMRDLPYIRDARFLVKSVPGDGDSVDLVLLSQDFWPYGIGAELSSANSGIASLWYVNLLGFGRQLKASLFWDTQHTPLLGYGFNFGIPNFRGTFVSTDLEYISKWNARTFGAGISRDFRTTKFKYAGAVRIENSRLIKDIADIDTTLNNIPWNYTNYDFWLGRMFAMRRNTRLGMSSGLFLLGRAFMNKNYKGPVTEEHAFYAYQDKTQLFFSTGYSKQRFTRDNMIYTFGRTEDVPSGFLLEFTAGKEWGQYKSRTYIAASGSFGKYLKKSGYIFGQLQYGTFIYGNSLEQGTLHAEIGRFSRLYSSGRFQIRNFATMNYLNGINRYQDEFTSLENNGGIQGLRSFALRGNEKLVLNLESVIFSPFNIYGFRFAFFGSVNAGFVKPEKRSFFESDLFTGFGVGVRIRNDQLVFDTFELRFNFYPGKPGDSHPSMFYAGSLPKLRLENFFPDKPEVVQYQER